MLFVGTSGYSYEDWRGYFYPKWLPKSKFLEFYSKHFNACEINSTYYRMPTPEFLGSLVRRVGITFSVKAPSIFTHRREWGRSERDIFLKSLEAMGESLGCVLFQLPHSFHLNSENLDYIKKVASTFADIPKVFEFRSAEWVAPQVSKFLGEIKAGFCCVDEPRIKGLVPPLVVCTSNIGYVRFHGRNAEKWYKHGKPEERYDYLYSKDELEEWAGKIRKMADKTEKLFAFFNNHPRAQAVKNAKDFMEILS